MSEWITCMHFISLILSKASSFKFVKLNISTFSSTKQSRTPIFTTSDILIYLNLVIIVLLYVNPCLRIHKQPWKEQIWMPH